jgi:formylglycine-generating enzyme required for sulfatase activity
MSTEVMTAFLSSTGRDLQVHRDAIQSAVAVLDNWQCFSMETFGASAGRSVLDYCVEKVRECDVFIGVIGFVYGSDPGDGVSYTEYEYIAAATKPRLLFVAPDTFQVPYAVIKSEGESARARQEAFRARLVQDAAVPGAPDVFANPDRLAAAVVASMRNWEQEERRLRSKPLAPTTPLAGIGTCPGQRQWRDIEAPSCPELVTVGPGTFVMGSGDDDPDAYPDEAPPHGVEIAKPFGIGRYLITFDEFDHYCETTGFPLPYDEGWGRGRRPVVNVSWLEAQTYLAWLSLVTGYRYRLPTEAEWEFACRAGTTTRFYCGDRLSVKHANYDMDPGRTTVVGSYPANPWGLYDITGNLWEFTLDTFQPSYDGAPSDGRACIDLATTDRRVVRGGSFSYDAKDNRSAIRCDLAADLQDRQHGFRVVRELTPES